MRNSSKNPTRENRHCLSDPERIRLLKKRQQQELQTIQKLFEQQLHSVEDRIVSISQPYVRPIVRGKAGADVEFGNKVMTSVVNGYCFIEKMSFDSFNEGVSLIDAVENYRNRRELHCASVFGNEPGAAAPGSFAPNFRKPH
jgi:transposase, IS5 family